MEATIVDLRYNMKDVLRALDRNEEVTITYRGKVKGVIVPKTEKKKKRKRMRVEDHPFFGMSRDDPRTVEEIMGELRGGRFRDL
jgi:prevent-host-death family protein